jgi:hypothetical protein
VAHRGYERAFDAGVRKPIKRTLALKAIEGIWAEHHYRLSSSYIDRIEQLSGYSLTKNETAKNFLRREIYALGGCLMKNPPSWDVSEIAGEIRKRPTTRPDALTRTFHALLMCIYEEDDLISRQERSLIAQELEYAHRHNVPPELLCGFLYQSGARAEIRKKLASAYVEPAFSTDEPSAS